MRPRWQYASCRITMEEGTVSIRCHAAKVAVRFSTRSVKTLMKVSIRCHAAKVAVLCQSGRGDAGKFQSAVMRPRWQYSLRHNGTPARRYVSIRCHAAKVAVPSVRQGRMIPLCFNPLSCGQGGSTYHRPHPLACREFQSAVMRPRWQYSNGKPDGNSLDVRFNPLSCGQGGSTEMIAEDVIEESFNPLSCGQGVSTVNDRVDAIWAGFNPLSCGQGGSTIDAKHEGRSVCFNPLSCGQGGSTEKKSTRSLSPFQSAVMRPRWQYYRGGTWLCRRKFQSAVMRPRWQYALSGMEVTHASFQSAVMRPRWQYQVMSPDTIWIGFNPLSCGQGGSTAPGAHHGAFAKFQSAVMRPRWQYKSARSMTSRWGFNPLSCGQGGST